MFENVRQRQNLTIFTHMNDLFNSEIVETGHKESGFSVMCSSAEMCYVSVGCLHMQPNKFLVYLGK